jgi:hypothetical protein
MRSKVPTAVKMSTMVIVVVMPCGLVSGYPFQSNTLPPSSALKTTMDRKGKLFIQILSNPYKHCHMLSGKVQRIL